MESARAFEVFLGKSLVGYLGEGGGPFLSDADSDLGAPVLRHVRYTSVDFASENVVSEILVGGKTFDDVLSALAGRGFSLAPAVYDDVFMPVAVAGRPRRRRE